LKSADEHFNFQLFLGLYSRIPIKQGWGSEMGGEGRGKEEGKRGEKEGYGSGEGDLRHCMLGDIDATGKGNEGVKGKKLPPESATESEHPDK
jgi:hypothetical protein